MLEEEWTEFLSEGTRTAKLSVTLPSDRDKGKRLFGNERGHRKAVLHGGTFFSQASNGGFALSPWLEDSPVPLERRTDLAVTPR